MKVQNGSYHSDRHNSLDKSVQYLRYEVLEHFKVTDQLLKAQATQSSPLVPSKKSWTSGPGSPAPTTAHAGSPLEGAKLEKRHLTNLHPTKTACKSAKVKARKPNECWSFKAHLWHRLLSLDGKANQTCDSYLNNKMSQDVWDRRKETKRCYMYGKKEGNLPFPCQKKVM